MREKIQQFLRFLPVLAALFIAIQIVLTNQFVPSGREVRSLDVAIDAVRGENELLQQQVASSSSLLAVGQKAAEAGFKEPTKSQLMTVGLDTLPVALR